MNDADKVVSKFKNLFGDVPTKPSFVPREISETTKALIALGLRPTVEAKPHTIAGLVKAVQS